MAEIKAPQPQERIPIPRPAPSPAGWRRWAPGLLILRRYQSSWLPHDLMAGLVLTAMLVPVGIAYAEASGIPGVNGLYATVIPLCLLYTSPSPRDS